MQAFSVCRYYTVTAFPRLPTHQYGSPVIKGWLGHEKIQAPLGTYGYLYPNTNLEVANKLTSILQYTPVAQSVAAYTSNQYTAAYHKEMK